MLNKLANEIHENAVAHGWWDNPPRFGEIVALCHAELSEALEEYRAGRPMLWHACEEGEQPYPSCAPGDIYDCTMAGQEEKCAYYGAKPEGIAVEMADCLIRILDWAGHEGVDMDAIVRAKMDYNKARPYRHGGKRL